MKVSAAAKKIAELPYIDEDRIGIWGWSFGGHMSTNCLLKGSDIFKMAIAVALYRVVMCFVVCRTKFQTYRFNLASASFLTKSTLLLTVVIAMVLLVPTGPENQRF